MPTSLPDRASRLDGSTHRRRRRAGRVTIAVLLLLGAFIAAPLTAPASATWTETHAYNLGNAKAKFTVGFKTKHSFTIGGWLKDICPADSRGVYMFMYVYHHRELGDWGGMPYDNNGCGNGRFNLLKTAYSAGSDKIRWLRVLVCEMDQAETAPQVCRGWNFRNPFVG